MDRRILWVCATACALIALAPPATAQTPDQVAPEVPAITPEPTGPLPAPVTPPEINAAQDMVTDDELAGLRGGAQIVVTNQSLTAITAGNVINGDYLAGTVTLSDNALSNFTGIGNLLINTGAQVSLQTGVNVTLNVNQ